MASIMVKHFRCLICLWAAFWWAPSVAIASLPPIVVFLSDDHTWRDSSVYGSPDIKTPNMVRLAADGMVFDEAYVVSPSCAPSRAALLTGLWPQRNGAEANHSRPKTELKKLPAYLQELGYEMVSFGKVGHYRQTTEYGFDLARHFNYHEDIAVSEALQWLEARASDQPLCLFVGSNWPHVPWPEDHEGIEADAVRIPPNHVDGPVAREWRARYQKAIETMDRELGQVYDLARRKLGEDVFFLHTSDHGAQWPFGKWSLYDDGLHTPLIASWKGRIQPGVRTKAMVSWLDILPTLIDVAGGPVPPDLDGRSFLPVLRGESDSHRDVVFGTHSGDGNFNVFPIRSMRTLDGWKYVRNLHPEFLFQSHVTLRSDRNSYWLGWLEEAKQHPSAKAKVLAYQRRPPEELYHVAVDPYEQINVIESPEAAARLASMRGSLDQWMTETNDTQTVFGEPRFQANGKLPNVITVLIDDMGWSDLSCFGGKRVTTPEVDRLASEGIRFTQFYVNSPICSPSRVALTTGQYPQRWRISSYLAERGLNRDRGMAQWLDLKAPVLARSLQRVGYATGHFGKWHMGGQRDVGNAPLISAYGFDQSLTNFEGLGPRVLPLKDAYDGKPPQPHDLGSASLGNGPIRWEDRSVITTSFVNEALSFMDSASVTEQPFFINLWPDDVHSPFFPPKALREGAGNEKRALYDAVLKAMDQQLGVLFERVRSDPRLRDNTLILLASDNGPESGAGTAAPLRGSKTYLYEGGIRSPLIAWGPGLLAEGAAGSTDEASVFCALDVNRSLYSLTNSTVPEGVRLDGEDVLDVLLGKERRSRKAPIFWRRPPDRPGDDDNPNPDLAVRDGAWKLLTDYDGGSVQLYDLIKDPGETTNLAESHSEVVARLSNALQSWHRSMPPDAGRDWRGR